MTKYDKKTLIFSAGAAVGVLQTVASREWGICPLIGGYLPSIWNRSGVVGNIILGTLVLGISQGTKLFNKSATAKNFFTIYSTTILVGGFVNAVFPTGTTPPPAGLGLRNQALGGNGVYTHNYYNAPTSGLFYRRPQSPARGFGSDITRNPMAMIPTEIPYNQVIS